MAAYFRTLYHRVPSDANAIHGAHQHDNLNEQHGSQDYRAFQGDFVTSQESTLDDDESDISRAHIEHLFDQYIPRTMNPGDMELRPMTPSKSVSVISSHTRPDKEYDRLSAVLLGPKPQMWNPFWLTKGVLMAFAVTFAMMCVAVVLLFHFSSLSNGLGTQEQSRHYAWTYGPTAFLTIVVSFWRQVDFSNRRLMPWRELQNGPRSADKTVLMEYITPILPVTIYHAMKRRHWAILTSTLGILLLKLSTIFSTGLIVLEPTTVYDHNVTFSLTSAFDGSKFSMSNISTTAAERYYGILSEGLQYPLGTGPDIVVQNLEPQLPLAPQSSYMAEVQGFKPDLDCEILDISNSSIKTGYLPWYSIQGKFWLINITTPDCTIQNAIVAQSANHAIHNQPNATENFQGRIANYTCSDGVDSSQPYYYRPDNTNNDKYPEHRVLMTMADLHWITPPEDVGAIIESEVQTWWVSNLTAVLCRPSYTMNTYQVEYAAYRNASQDPVKAVQVQNSTKLPDFTDADLGAAVIIVPAQVESSTGGADYVLADRVPYFFQILAAANNNSRQEPFMNATLLRDLGVKVWNGIATQFAQDNLMSVTDDLVVGKVKHSEERLQVKGLSTIFMAVLFGLLCCASILVLLSRPQDVVPGNPGSISATMAILAASPAFTESLSNLGSAGESKILQSIAGHRFQSLLLNERDPTFAVDVTKGQPHVSSSKDADHEEVATSKSAHDWWYPMASRRWFHLLAFLLPLILIVLLEVLQRVSDAHHGLVQVNGDKDLGPRILASYLPALVMLGVATLYNSIESNSAILAPYARLKRGNLTARSSYITTDFLSKLPPHALFLATKMLNFGHIICILAVFVAAFLTVVVSGLYTTAEVPGSFNSTLTRADTLDFGAGSFYTSDGGAGAITSLIEYSDLAFPPWTYQGLVFDKLLAPANTPDTGSITVKVPAYRTLLNCSIGFDYSLSIVNQEAGGASPVEVEEGRLVMAVDATVPIACERMVTNYTTVTWAQSFHVPNDTSPAYVGQGTELSWSRNDTSIGSDWGPSVAGSGADISNSAGAFQNTVVDNLITNYGCPTFGFTLGTAAVERKSHKNGTVTLTPDANLTLAMCYQNLQQVQTNLTLNLPDLTINSAIPPVTDESTAIPVKNGSADSLIWEWPTNSLFATLKNLTTKSDILAPSGGDPSMNDIDMFIQTLVQGKSPVPISSMIGEAGYDNFLKAAARLHHEWMAQALSATVRIPVNSSTSDNKTVTYPARVMNVTRWRLQQNNSPKIALQVMLAILAAAAAVTYFLNDVRRVLPHNPCSIAGAAALLADSNVCTRDSIPVGAEWASEKELRDTGVLGGIRLGMGWFEREDGREVFGIHAEKNGE